MAFERAEAVQLRLLKMALCGDDSLLDGRGIEPRNSAVVYTTVTLPRTSWRTAPSYMIRRGVGESVRYEKLCNCSTKILLTSE